MGENKILLNNFSILKEEDIELNEFFFKINLENQ